MKHSLSKQSGHAAILFAMMIPALFGLFTLASDGARALQKNARLQDATEAATLAIAAHNEENVDTGEAGSGSQINRDIVTKIVDQYMVDATGDVELKIVRKLCDPSEGATAGCGTDSEEGDARYFQFEIEARTVHDSWFPGNDAIVGFGETFGVAGSATARKYQSKAIDVMLVSDFSGSMKKSLCTECDDDDEDNTKKYEDLIAIVETVQSELDKFNRSNNTDKNTLGFTAYNFFTIETLSGNKCYRDQLYYNSSENSGATSYSIDYSKVIANLLTKKSSCLNLRNDQKHGEHFSDIDLTDSFSASSENDSCNENVDPFSCLGDYTPGGGTALFQGLIRGAQILNEGSNERRLMIVLSDGADSDDWYPLPTGSHSSSNQQGESYATVSDKLARDYGLCDTIKTRLESSGNETSIVGIGFGYDPTGSDANIALQECVGDDNLYEAESADEVLDIILKLITEEIGHLK